MEVPILWGGATPADRYVYHFTSMCSALKILASGTFRFSALSSLNDPIEHRVRRIQASGPIDDESVPTFAEIVDLWEDAWDRTRIASFVADDPSIEVPTGANAVKNWRRGFGHPRMWAQYGGNHAGACLVFEREELGETISSIASAEVWHLHGRVKYDNDVLNHEPAFARHETTRGEAKQYVEGRFEAEARRLLLHKASDWTDENEYRYLVLLRESERFSVPLFPALRAVLVGHLSTADDRGRLIIASAKRELPVGEMVWDITQPTIVWVTGTG